MLTLTEWQEMQLLLQLPLLQGIPDEQPVTYCLKIQPTSLAAVAITGSCISTLQKRADLEVQGSGQAGWSGTHDNDAALHL